MCEYSQILCDVFCIGGVCIVQSCVSSLRNLKEGREFLVRWHWAKLGKHSIVCLLKKKHSVKLGKHSKHYIRYSTMNMNAGDWDSSIL